MEQIQITPIGYEKASSKLTNEQLDKPLDEVVAEAPAESVPETPIKVESSKVSKTEPDEEKVPKSRFLTMHQRAVEAEKALRQFEAERESRPEPVYEVDDDEELKKFYTTTFGETELADKLYQNEIKRLQTIEERASERAYERMSAREQEDLQLIDRRVESMDSAFEELGIVEGKDFTDDEQVAMLDIVEKYSPKDKNGKIPEEYLLPLDQAYEIYQLQQEQAKPNRSARNAVAALSGSRSEGAPGTTSDADWNPRDQRRWWDKTK